MAFNTSGDSDGVLSEINITPLVDVMLVLLVAFIVTAPAMSNAVHVNLPKTAATAPPNDIKAVTISLDAQGLVYLNRELIAQEAVEPQLRSLKAENAELTLNLQADDTVPYGSVAKVMAAIERAGVSRLSVLTNPN
ncbi:MAG: biopolymer transport ExbD/TolR family protein [Verrucomicrobiaceae bacterium]|nr:biopolymer transport ExbD/TolR family protein [Verrucomicrobiaceae bacterium]